MLFLGYHDRGVPARRFRRRRFGLVVMPYLVWSVVYTGADAWMVSDDRFPTRAEFLRAAAMAIVRGDAKYELYFLLVSTQIQLMFAALSALVRRTRGHHGKLLAAAAALQLPTPANCQRSSSRRPTRCICRGTSQPPRCCWSPRPR